MDATYIAPQSYAEPAQNGGLGSLTIHERYEDEDREVTNEPIGFVHFKDSNGRQND